MDILVRDPDRVPDDIRRRYGTAAGVHQVRDQRLLDSSGNYRDYEIYTAEEYSGASTQWNLVANGKRDYGWTGVPTPYDYPAQKYMAGRYLKFVILKAEYNMASGDYQFGRGKLADVQGLGF